MRFVFLVLNYKGINTDKANLQYWVPERILELVISNIIRRNTKIVLNNILCNTYIENAFFSEMSNIDEIKKKDF